MNTICKVDINSSQFAVLENPLTFTEGSTLTPTTDCRVFIDPNPDEATFTLTLPFSADSEGVKVELFALRDCTINYAPDDSTTENFTMVANTTATFIYHNGWKHLGIYDAVWN